MRVIRGLIVILTLTFYALPCPAQQDSVQHPDSTLLHSVAASLLHPAQTLDEILLIEINHWVDNTGFLDKPAAFLSDAAVYAVIGVPVGLYIYGLAAKNTTFSYAGASTFLSVGASALITEGLKELIQRPRPYCSLDSCRYPDTFQKGYSFPSGHATAIWALATGLMLHFPKWYIIGPSIIGAGIVSLSRPYLAVHYPTDILAGAIIGSLTSYLCWKMENRWFRNGGKIINPGGVPPSFASSARDLEHVTFAFDVPVSF